MENIRVYAVRLGRGKDLRGEIEKFAEKNKIKAGVVLTCVGNLEKVIIRLAGAKTIKKFSGSFEILSLVGTFETGDCHLHISFSDNKGKVYGGHLKKGSIVGVTVELVLGEIKNLKFSRRVDRNTGYEELEVKRRIDLK